MKWKNWLRGLISAGITASATSFTTTVVAPDTFNFQEGTGKVVTVALVAFVFGCCNFLQKSPLPGGKKNEPIAGV